MQYAVCCVPVSPLRKEPSHNVEMISQELFGECCAILENSGSWVKIKCQYDGYEGWCQASHLVEIDGVQFHNLNKKLTIDWINEASYNHSKMIIPLGSSMGTFKKNKAVWREDIISYKGEMYNPDKEKINRKFIKWICKKYLNTPYLWGGKSVFGIDCSGFSQAVYKFLDIYLPRDSWQQAEPGETIELLPKANCGDLCFFDNEEGRITHVGLLLNHHTIIHSSGRVRIDKINNAGIINSDTGQQTHKLKVIKRYF